MPQEKEEKFGVPLLSYKELAKRLREDHEFECFPEDIENPTALFAEQVYQKFIEKTFDLPRDYWTKKSVEIAQADEGLFQHSDHSVARVCFFKKINALWDHLEIKDFSLDDLYHPDGKRLRRFLSTLHNFALHKYYRAGMFTEAMEHSAEVRQELVRVQGVTEWLTAQRDELQAEQDERQGRLETQQRKNKEICQKLSDLRSETAGLSADVEQATRAQDAKKRSLADFAHKKKALQEQLTDHKDALVEGKEELEVQVAALTKKRTALTQRVDSLHQLDERTSAQCRVFEHLAAKAKAWEEQACQLEQLYATVATEKAAHGKIEEKIAKACRRVEALRQQRDQQIETLERLNSRTRQVKSKREREDEQQVAVREELREQCAAARGEQQALDATRRELLRRCRDLEAEKAEVTEAGRSRAAMLDSELQAVVQLRAEYREAVERLVQDRWVPSEKSAQKRWIPAEKGAENARPAENTRPTEKTSPNFGCSEMWVSPSALSPTVPEGAKAKKLAFSPAECRGKLAFSPVSRVVFTPSPDRFGTPGAFKEHARPSARLRSTPKPLRI